jgi:hypothetical protein
MPLDYKDYPENWKTEIVPRIQERDGHRCKFCSIANGIVIRRMPLGAWRHPGAQEWDMIHSKVKYGQYTLLQSIKFHGFTRIVLTVAHLDHDHNNNDDENLAALCQRCHLHHDRQQHADNRRYGRNWKKYQLKLNLV